MTVRLRVGKVLVTGGASGIGFAITRALLAEGCDVCICGRGTDSLERAKRELDSPRLFTITFDVLNVDGMDELIKTAASLMGGIDALVNSAGISSRSVGKPGWEETENGWDSIVDINLKGTVFLTRKFAQYLKANIISGNILNISSAQGAAHKVVSAYQTAKLGVIKLTRGMGKDMAPFGIVINGVAPGATFSGMTPKPHSGDNHTKIHASGTMIEAEQIAQIALFLLSEPGSIIIGDTIFADNGFIGAN
jgi:NAD(P)-dependent dehydrogenase (short-subunit alcohol dehydrogenase family)